MSYSLLVQGDRPVGYWRFNGDGNDSIGSNNAILSSVQYTTPPLVANNSSALIVRPSGTSASIYNSYDAFYSNTERKSAFFEFWFSFNNLLDGSGYSKNSSSITRYYTSNQLDIIKIMNGTTQIGRIYYDYNKHTFRFSINGIGNEDAYIPIRNINNSFYIVAGYREGLLNIFCNGISGIGGEVTNTQLFPSRTSSVYFVIDNASLNSSSANYIISDLALYNYELNLEQKRKRVVWSMFNDKPTITTGLQATSYFDFYERDYHVAHYENVEADQFKNYSYEFNTYVNHEYGIAPKQIDSLGLLSASGVSASISYSPTYGASISNIGSLFMSDFGKIISETNNIIISAQVTRRNNPIDYIFSFTDSNSSKIIYATVSSAGFYLNQYDPATSASSTILSALSTLSTGTTYNFGFLYTSGSISIYGNGISSSTTYPSIVISNGTSLEIANNLSLNNVPPTIQIKNLGISNAYQTDFSSYDFSSIPMYMARLVSDQSVSQKSVWIKRIPISNYDTQLVSSKFTWDGMENCLVEVSNDNGSTWTSISRGSQIPAITYQTVSSDILVRITVPYEYQPEISNQSFRDFQISLYRNLSLYSNDMKYELNPLSDSSGQHSYSIQRNQSPILMRKDNFGIKFDKYSGSVEGFAEIIPSSSAVTTYAYDFWARFDSFPSASNYLIDISIGSASGPYVYVDGTSKKFIYAPSNTILYINGSSVSSNSYTASLGEYYHIFYDLNSSASLTSTASVFLNSRVINYSGTHSHAVYGNLNLWQNPLNASTASTRYQSFIGNNIVTASLTPTNATLWQSKWNLNAIDSASGYKIG